MKVPAMLSSMHITHISRVNGQSMDARDQAKNLSNILRHRYITNYNTINLNSLNEHSLLEGKRITEQKRNERNIAPFSAQICIRATDE